MPSFNKTTAFWAKGFEAQRGVITSDSPGAARGNASLVG